MQVARVSLVVLAACAYRPGSYADFVGKFRGERVALACLDLAVEPGASDPYAQGPLVAYAFGNRCDHRVTVDLASIRAIGRDAEGRAFALAPYDPRHELRALDVDARWGARETIEYHPPRDDMAVTSICVDIGGVEPDAPQGEHWICTTGGAP